MKYIFRTSVLVCTLFIFLVLYGISKIPVQLEVLDPISKALKDFEMTDLVFGQMRKEQPLDTNIVLINIGDLSRADIGRQIQRINEHNPQVIGIDAMFRAKKDFQNDINLIMALSQVAHLVMVSDLSGLGPDATCFDSVETSHPQFSQFAVNGYADLKTSAEGFKTVRDFIPQYCAEDTIQQAFAVKIAQAFDSTSVSDLLARKREREVINWRGNYTKFYRLDYDQVLDPDYDLSFLQGKIVLLGFLGHHEIGERSLDDTFYTPLNVNSAGRSEPDMYGITVHANIISMILGRNYINDLPDWFDGILSFILLYLNVALFVYIAQYHKVYYDLVTKGIILVEIIFLFSFMLLSLLFFEVKINLTLAIIAIVFSGDLTELYIGSLRDLTIIWLKKIGIDISKYVTSD